MKRLFLLLFFINFISTTVTSQYYKDRCDTNRDGTVDISDVNMVISYICGELKDSVKISLIQLNETSISLKIGDVYSLSATITPDDATIKTCSWSSSNESVAVVTSNGTVFGRSKGKAIITCTAEDGSGIKASCQVYVDTENYSKSIISSITENSDIQIFSKALQLTGISQKLDSIEDASWSRRFMDGDFEAFNKQMLTSGSRDPEIVYCPQQRMNGYTIFITPDHILKEKYGITDVKALYQKACEIYDYIYPDDVSSQSHDFDHIDSPTNPLYRFMAYHILNRNVHEYNSLTVRDDAGVDINQMNPTAWYSTLLPYTMIKVEKLTMKTYKDNAEYTYGDRYINHRCDDIYKYKGIHIQPVVGDKDNIASNGIYFYIDDILKFDSLTRDSIQNDRIRMDFATIFPEIQTNNILMNGPATSSSASEIGYNYCFPSGYLNGIKYDDNTILSYWYPRPGYYSMYGDEMNVQGYFDITIDLPPVPFTGDWQIRLGYNTDERHTCVQCYIDGQAQGIPLNLSESIDNSYGDTFPSYEEIRNDSTARFNDFKTLKNKGYYRGPHSVFNSSNGMLSGRYNYFSEMPNTIRKVLATVRLNASNTHTLRLRDVGSKSKDMGLDYIELVPKSTYTSSENDL